MTEQEALDEIVRIVNRTLDDKGLDPVTITADTEMLGGDIQIDSLDLATLVAEMESVAGHDPFAQGFIEFKTAGELARLYAK